MWKFAAVLLCLSGYCLAGPVGQKRNMPIVQQNHKDIAMTETESAVNEDPNEMMIMSTLSLPSNATSIRADITDSFTCENRTYGYYADVDNDCQIFHVCLPVTYADGKENTFRWSFICPEDTIFSQDSFTCMRPDDMAIACEESYQYYELNRNFGTIESNVNKETSNEAATAESSETVSEAEKEAIKPVEQAEEEQIIAQAKPVIAAKPSRRKPSVAYATQRKPTNSYPLRKMPQAAESSANQISQTTNESAKPAEEEEVKPIVNKFARRPVSNFIKDKVPESPMAEEEIKPVEHKFIRRPIAAMNTLIEDKINNENTKPEAAVPSRTDLFNQLRKRPNLFNKKPVQQPEEEKPEEQAKAEIPAQQQNFSLLATGMSNLNTETQMADTETEASESNNVPVNAQEANEISQSEQTTSKISNEPVQVLEAFEEIPAVISEAVETPNAEEEVTPHEESLSITNVKSDNVEEPQIIEAVQSAEESDSNGNIHDEIQNSAEKTDINEETQQAQEAQAAEETYVIPQSLRTSAEVFQGLDETKTVEEPLNTQQAEESHIAEETQIQEHEAAAEEMQHFEDHQVAAEQTENIQEHQAAEEMQTVDEHQLAEETHNAELEEDEHEVAEEAHNSEQTEPVQEHQAAEEMQNVDKHEVAEGLLSAEQTPNGQELPADEEMQSADVNQVSEESETPEQNQIVEEVKADEESKIVADVSIANESLAAEDGTAGEEVLQAEEALAIDNNETEDGSQDSTVNADDDQNSHANAVSEEEIIVESPANEEVSAPEENKVSVQSSEDILEGNSKTNEEQMQNAEETHTVEESLMPAEETLVAEEPMPVIHPVEESLIPKESEQSQQTDEILNHPEESDNIAVGQTIEQMESEKTAEDPELMQATEEMSHPQPEVQQMYDEMNFDNQPLKEHKPVDPVMAQEAEQLIVDFINTLRKNDFTNETPGMQMDHVADKISEEQEANSGMLEAQDEEETAKSQENVKEAGEIDIAEKQDGISTDLNESQVDVAEETPQEKLETEEMELAKQESAPEEESKQDTLALKLLDNESVKNMDESQQSQESAVEAMILPQEIYQIPVKVITDPAEETAYNEQQSNEGETQFTETAAKTEEMSHEDESPAMHLAGNKPLSIDDIVELVKERLDQMPKNEMEAPMQLDHVLGEAEEKIKEADFSAAAQEDIQQSSSQSAEETVMPIYQRVAEPIQIAADEQSEAVKQNSNAAEKTQAVEDTSEVREKTNRSYKTKLDARKRRFLFKADSS